LENHDSQANITMKIHHPDAVMKILLPEIHRRGTCPFSRDPQVNFQVFCIFKQYPIADPGCLSRTPDPNFYHPGSRIRIKEFKYFKPKKMVSKLWEI
jgi:hypothetical protein